MAMNVIQKKEKKASKGSRSDVAVKDKDASNDSEDEGPRKPTRHKSSAAILGQLSAQLVGSSLAPKDKKEKKKKQKSLNSAEGEAVKETLKEKRKKLKRRKSASGLLSTMMDRSDKSSTDKKKEKKSSRQEKSSLDDKKESLSSKMEEGGGAPVGEAGGLSSHLMNRNRPSRRMSTGSVVSKESTKSKVSTFWMSDNLGIKAPGAAATKVANDEESVVSYHELKGTTEAIRRATEAANIISTVVKDNQERLQTLEEDLVTVASDPSALAPSSSSKKSGKSKGKKSALDLGYNNTMDGSEKKQSKKSKQKLENQVGLSSHLGSGGKRDRPRRRMSTGSVVSKESTKSKVSTFWMSENIGIKAPGEAPKAATDEESVVSYHEMEGTAEALKRSSDAANIVKMHQQHLQTLEQSVLGKLEEEEDIEAPVLLPMRTSTSSKKSKKSKAKKEIDESNNSDSERKRKVKRRMSTGTISHTMDASEKSVKKEKKKKKSKDKERKALDDESSSSRKEDGSGSSQGKRKGSRRMTTGGLTHSMDESEKSLKEKKKKSKKEKKKKEDDGSMDSSDKRKKLSRGGSSTKLRVSNPDLPPLKPMKEKKKKKQKAKDDGSEEQQQDNEDKPSRRMTTGALTQTNTPAKKEKKKKQKSKSKGDGDGGLLASHLQRKGRPKRRNSTGSVLSKESAKSKVSTFWMTDNLGIKAPGATTTTKQADEESVVSYHELRGTTEAIRRATEAANIISTVVKDNQLRLQTLEEDLVTVGDDTCSVFTTSKKTKDGKKQGLDHVWIMNDKSIFGSGHTQTTVEDDEMEDNSEAIRSSALAAEAALNVFKNQPETIRAQSTSGGDQLGDLMESERQKVQIEIEREQDLLDMHQHRLSLEESRPEASIFSTVRRRP